MRTKKLLALTLSILVVFTVTPMDAMAEKTQKRITESEMTVEALENDNETQKEDNIVEKTNELVKAEREMAAHSEENSGYNIGTITNADGLNGLGIDGVFYDTVDNFDFSKAATIWLSGDPKVVFKLNNDLIECVYAASDIMTVQVLLKTDPQKLVYQNGKMNVSEFDAVIEVRNNLNKNYDFIPSNIIKELGVSLSKIKLNATSDGINFGQNGFWFFKDNVTEIEDSLNQKINGQANAKYVYKVMINTDYKLYSANSLLGLKAVVTVDGKEHLAQGQITVGNLDYQAEQAQKKKDATSVGKKIIATKNEITGSAKKNVALDPKLSNYFNREQLLTVQKFLYTYCATVMSSTSSSYSKNDKVMDAVCKKMGINKNIITTLTNTEASIDYEANTKLGKRRIHFTVNLDGYRLGNGSNYAGNGSIKYSVYEINTANPESTGTCLVTYTDVREFVENLQTIAEETIQNGYNSFWGNSTNKIASYLTEGTIIEVLKDNGIIGEFSNELFKVLEAPSKRHIKTSIKCPVDVKVYDLYGNLCGSVKDNIIDT